MGLREYGRSRKARGLAGASLAAVQEAIRTGRLHASLTPDRAAIADPDLADREMAENTDDTMHAASGPTAPAGAAAVELPPGVPPAAVSRARREAARARQAEIEVGRLEGRFIDAAQARADVEQAYSLVRTRLLRVPSDLAQRGVAPDVTALVDELIRHALEELAAPAALTEPAP